MLEPDRPTTTEKPDQQTTSAGASPDPTVARHEAQTKRYQALSDSVQSFKTWNLESGDALADPLRDLDLDPVRAARDLWLQSAFEAMRRIADDS